MIDDLDERLTKQRKDRAQLDDLYATKELKDAAASLALEEQSAANDALGQGIANFEADKETLLQAVKDELTSGPPEPPAPPIPPAPPANG